MSVWSDALSYAPELLEAADTADHRQNYFLWSSLRYRRAHSPPASSPVRRTWTNSYEVMFGSNKGDLGII